MRAFILIAGASLALAGCKNNDQHDNTMNVDENLTAEKIVSNDVTAIDAVTGDAANMAADVDMNFGGLAPEGAAANVQQNSARPSKEPKRPAPATESNSTANVAANAE